MDRLVYVLVHIDPPHVPFCGLYMSLHLDPADMSAPFASRPLEDVDLCGKNTAKLLFIL
jgi:hypothetical protein